MGETIEIGEGEVDVAVLDVADVGTVDVRSLCKLGLRDLQFLCAVRFHVSPDDLGECPSHGSLLNLAVTSAVSPGASCRNSSRAKAKDQYQAPDLVSRVDRCSY